MRRVTDFQALRCPRCRGHLSCHPPQRTPSRRSRGELRCSCGETFEILDGIPDLVFPRDLAPTDHRARTEYDTSADRYQEGLDWLFASFGEEENAVRSRLTDLLDCPPGARVLDLGCGTGSDSLHIASRLGVDGELFLLDLSRPMIEKARQALGEAPLAVLGNALHLPFPDHFFDATFHFGGLNTFSDKRRALAEAARVTRPGGRVVIGDEGVAPWLRRRRYGRILVDANPLYRHRPPIELLPAEARDVALRWILGNAFYVLDFLVAEAPPELDLDLPIPGRGDSLRSRHRAGCRRRSGGSR